ncbi:MAG: phosphohydrolase [Burkholderiales bacterium 28-67-8]|nr:MAG: phosphohydrolase [Burkholderiales bacterium 28-67-8]
MNPTPNTELIEVSALRLGMFVHLDDGWMSHPFAFSSFKITSEEQLATLRSIGLSVLRWSPRDSDPESSAPAKSEPGQSAATPEQQALVDARRAHRELLNEQRRALAACERQFGEATRASTLVFKSVAEQPADAGQAAQVLVGQLVTKMVGSQDMCIRLLSEGAGDKVSAHAVSVSVICLLMGRTLGLGEADMLDLGMGALLHDVGKIDIPFRYHHREDHFNASEHKFYESHVATGTAHARRLGLSPGASVVIAQHHECSDGSGFPLGINSDRTTVLSRIVALVNAYDNLCNPVNPARAVTPHEAVAQLFAQGRNRFDMATLGAFIKMMGVYPAGSVVQLTDDRFALVVGVNFSRGLRPRVLVHDPKVPRDEAVILDLEAASGLGIRRSLKPTSLPEAALGYLSPRPRVNYFFEPARVLEPQL